MTVKFGIIGAGSIARHRHLPEIKMNPDADVIAICDIVQARAKEMAKIYDCKAHREYQNMLRDPNLDAVVVAATNTTHAEMTIAALNAGKHVLCEKPMATNLDDAQKMINTAQVTGKSLMIAHNQRLEKAHQKAKQIIHSGELGRVLSFTSIFGHPGPESWAIDGPNTWFFKKDIAGLGVLGDLAIHKFDLLRWMLEDNFIEAVAFTDTLSKTYPNGAPINVEDNAFCQIRTQRGAVGSVITSWSYQKENNSTTIYCEKGVLEIFVDPDFPLVVHHDFEHAEYYKLGKKSTNVEQIKSGIIDTFVGALVNNQEVPIPGIEGYRALEVVVGCQNAAESGQAVPLD